MLEHPHPAELIELLPAPGPSGAAAADQHTSTLVAREARSIPSTVHGPGFDGRRLTAVARAMKGSPESNSDRRSASSASRTRPAARASP